MKTELIYIPFYAGGPNTSSPSKDLLEMAEKVLTLEELSCYRPSKPPIYIGGDQTITLWTIHNTIITHGDNVYVVYLDSHADINTEGSSLTGNIHSMVLHPEFRARRKAAWVPLNRIVWYGLKDVDEFERVLLEQSECEEHSLLVMPKSIPIGAKIHLVIDMDCMKLESGVSYPFNSGFSLIDVMTFIDCISVRYDIVAAEIAEYIPDLDRDRSVYNSHLKPLIKKLQHTI